MYSRHALLLFPSLLAYELTAYQLHSPVVALLFFAKRVLQVLAAALDQTAR